MLILEVSWQGAAVASAALIGAGIAGRRLARPRQAQAQPTRAQPTRAQPTRGRQARGRQAQARQAQARQAQARQARGWPTRVRLAMVAAFTLEAGTVFALFALWQLAGSHQILGPAGAVARARWLWHAERVLRMPSEAALQRAFLPHPLLIQALNLYYAGLHFGVLIACLIWLFAWHRDSYPRVRSTIVIFTGLSLLLQFIPVAPPRMLPGDGMVDTAVRYGQSVYGSVAGFNADQLSAMPSVHVGWALIVAIVIVHVSRSRWRWLALGYPVLTTLAVVVTANHFWVDGAGAAVLLALTLLLQRAGQAIRRRLTRPDAAPHRELIRTGAG